MQIQHLIIALLLGFSCSLCRADDLEQIKNAFNKINDYLTNEVPTADPDANFDAAQNWLKVAKGQLTDEFLAVLSMFVNLRNIATTGECSEVNMQIIDQSDRAVGSPRLNTLPSLIQLPKKRIDKLVYHFATEYYTRCFPDNVTAQYNKLEPETFRRVMKLGSIRDLPTSQDSLASKYMELLANESSVSKENLSAYIVQPCQELKSVYGSEFSDLVGEIELKQYDPHTDNHEEITRKRLALMHCQFIVDNEERIWGDMVQSMES